jgi:hypothetical protein
MSATLRLTREISLGIELRRGRFEISVDGDNVASIDNNPTVETPVQPGRHTVQIRHGRYSSRELSFEVAGRLAAGRPSAAATELWRYDR